MKKSRLLFTLALVSVVALTGCRNNKVERVETDETIDLSGYWNDIDSQLVSKEMIANIAAHPWIEEYREKSGKKPVVIVGTIRNLSDEHIETETFTKDLERELVNSGRVTFVASKLDRLQLREEREAQQSQAREETRKKLMAETGADYMLQGGIRTIIDQEGNRAVKFYQVDLEMVHLETNEKVWMGGKKIKKDVTKRNVKW